MGVGIPLVGLGGTVVEVADGVKIGVSGITIGVVVGSVGIVDVDLTSIADPSEVAAGSRLGSLAVRAQPSTLADSARQHSNDSAWVRRDSR